MLGTVKGEAFDVVVPWRIDARTDIAVGIRDRRLLGSQNHLLRLDLYPLQAPSHPERHHGYWDVPMAKVSGDNVILRLTDEALIVGGASADERFPPTWRGALPLAGAAVLTVSLLDVAQQPARTVHQRASRHLLLHAASGFPLVRATIQVTTRCNLSCRGCKREHLRQRGGAHTSPEVVDPVIAASGRLSCVLIHADGEPLLNPDVPGILSRLKSTMPRHGRVGLVTNAMRLDRDTARDLLDRGLDWLAVSIDGASRATMEGIRRGSRLERVAQNVAYAVDYGSRVAPEGLAVTIQFTIREENAHEIPAMVLLAGRMGARNLSLGHLIRWETGAFQPVAKEVVAPLIEEARESSRQNGVHLMVPQTEPLNDRQCPCLDEVVVLASGDVAPCNFRRPGRPWESNLNLGNVRERPLHEIWESPAAVDLRRRLAAADFPAACEPCCFSRWGSSV